MKKSVLIILSCIICIVAFQAFSVKQAPTYQNLKILPSDIGEHELDSIMHHFSGSLGVRCDFCHVRIEAEKKMDFASDAKPEKDVARGMMRMAIDINKNYFSGEWEKEGKDHVIADTAMSAMGIDKVKIKKDKMKVKGDDRKIKKDLDGDMHAAHPMNPMNMDSMRVKDVKYMLMEVNCYTCHRGSEHPDSKLPPPPPRPQGPPPAEKPAAPVPPAKN